MNAIVTTSPETSPETGETQKHTITVDDGKTEGAVNTSKPRSTHVRMPVQLAQRIARLRDEAQRAYREGRIDVPSTMVDFVPAWFVIERALDEQEARRARSNRPRKK